MKILWVQGPRKIVKWGGGGGHIFIYSCYAQLISFEIEIKILKSIVFTVCEQEYMNMCPPTYRSYAAPVWVSIHCDNIMSENSP